MSVITENEGFDMCTALISRIGKIELEAQRPFVGTLHVNREYMYIFINST
jgi:hypothetical protein